jgi:hypothetical protein
MGIDIIRRNTRRNNDESNFRRNSEREKEFRRGLPKTTK